MPCCWNSLERIEGKVSIRTDTSKLSISTVQVTVTELICLA